MLCKNCLQGLKNVHEFILKALDSYNFLMEVNGTKCDVVEDNEFIIEEVESCGNDDEFETVLVEKTDTESVIEDHFEYENSNGEIYTTTTETTSLSDKNIETKIEISPVKNVNKYTTIEIVKEEFEKDQTSPKENTASDSIRRSKRNLNSRDNEEILAIIKRSKMNEKEEGTGKVQTEETKNRNQKKPKRRYNVEHTSQNTPSMCSICCK